MPVLNIYQEPNIETIVTKIDGRTHKNNWTVGDLDKIKPRKAAQAVAPNFVHSIDATQMHAVLLAALAEAIEMVGVHDCFGAVAPVVGRLKQIVIEQFCRVHEHDWLGAVLERARQDLPKSAKLPSLPETGNVNIRPSEHAYK